MAFRLARRAFSPYKLQIGILVVLGFVSSLLEGIGINALIPLISIITGESSGGADAISRIFESLFNAVGVDFSLKFILIFFVALFVLKAFVVLLFNYIRAHITSNYEAEVRTSLFRKMVQARWDYLRGQKLGHLETVLMTNVRFASNLLERTGEVIIILTGLLVYSVIAFNISPNITLLTLALGALLFLVLKPLLSRTRLAAAETAGINRQTAHYINESITGLKTIKASTAGQSVILYASKLFDALRRLRIRVLVLRGIGGSLIQPISIIFVSVVFAASYKLPEFQLGAFVAVVYLIQRIFAYVQQLQGNIHHMSEAAPYLQHILSYEDEAIEHEEKETGTDQFSFERALTFKEVGFSYDTDGSALTGISFTVSKGSFFGLVGASGSGKTTVTDLMLRLFTPTQGIIELDGIPIQDISIDEWRRHIEYVSQDMFLMNDTIANNIRFYDGAISDEDVIAAAKQANIYEFIQSCPDGFETMMGERGTRLSAGQRQRVAIARALARKPAILILDEATSALDNESEAQIQKAIEELRGTVTVIVIAHRLSTVLHADSLVVLDRGKEVEEGLPQELLKNPNSHFYALYHAQV